MEIRTSRTADFSGLRKANSERRVYYRTDAQSANRKNMPFLRLRDQLISLIYHANEEPTARLVDKHTATCETVVP